jgi:hypothetical protein
MKMMYPAPRAPNAPGSLYSYSYIVPPDLMMESGGEHSFVAAAISKSDMEIDSIVL